MLQLGHNRCVPVTINVVDANGNYRPIGTTITDASGMFTYAWAPDIEGAYTVIALFDGTNGYYGSSARTSFYATSAPATPTPQPTQEPSAADQYFIPAIAGLFAFVAIMSVVTILVLRKRP